MKWSAVLSCLVLCASAQESVDEKAAAPQTPYYLASYYPGYYPGLGGYHSGFRGYPGFRGYHPGFYNYNNLGYYGYNPYNMFANRFAFRAPGFFPQVKAPAPVNQESMDMTPATQYHFQDGLGNINYGYSNVNSAKQEVGNIRDGVQGQYYMLMLMESSRLSPMLLMMMGSECSQTQDSTVWRDLLLILLLILLLLSQVMSKKRDMICF